MRYSRIILAFSLLMLLGIFYSYADRGLRKKSKNNVTLNIKTSPNFNNALNYNLKTGLKYTGMLNYTAVKNNNLKNEYINKTINSYKKGNTIYIIPKYKAISTEIKHGYSGIKLTLASNK